MGAPRIKRTRHREVATHPLRVTPWSHPTGLYSSTEKVFDGRPLALGLGVPHMRYVPQDMGPRVTEIRAWAGL